MLQVLVVLWISYFITLIAVVEMMPRQFSRFTGFLGSKVNYIMWWCFLKAMWKAVRGRLGFKNIVFKVLEHKSFNGSCDLPRAHELQQTILT